MLALADDRIEDLKSRGYDNAGVYDPEGVGGTHVIYVLHHADKPGIYSDRPENPRISPIVEGWKGVTKTAGMGFECVLGAKGGYLLDTMTGEKNSIQRRGNMYIMKLWVKDRKAGFTGQD